MLLGGLASHSLVLWILPLLQQEAIARLPSPVSSTIMLVLDVVALLVTLGGITVIFGGLALLGKHRTTGRLLIALGGGAGFLGLLVALGFYVWTNGIAGVEAHVGYWVGVILAVIAWIATGKRRRPTW